MTAVCEAAASGCGGCDMLGVPYAEQVKVRRGILEAAFTKAFARMSSGVAIPAVSVVHGSEWGYRARVQLTDGGFQKWHTNERVEVKHCPVATAEVNAYLEAGARNEGRVMVFGDKRVMKPTCRSTVYRNAKPPMSPTDDTTVCVELCGRELRFDVRGFFQSNMGMLERAIPLICGGLVGHNVLDMYAGCGTFSTFLSDAFDMVTLVEKDAISVTFAEANMAGKPHKCFALSGERWVKYHKDEVQFDAAVFDPPRAGLEKAVLQYLVNHPVPVVRYLSCCAATHARDCAALSAGGYTLDDLTLLDFYPQTHRTESLATLRWEGN